MSLCRRLSRFVCRFIAATLPPSLRPWGEAIRQEVAAIDDDRAAFAFALAGLRGLAGRGIAFHLVHPFAASGGSTDMPFDNAIHRPRAMGIACGIGAVLLGLAYLGMAGAPWRYLILNAVALGVGLAALTMLGRVRVARWSGAASMAGAGALLATALLGQAVDGAARWVSLGGLSLQPSLVLLPAMIAGYARVRTPLASGAMLVAAFAMALQPDRAMAGMLALGLGAVAWVRPGWPERLVALAASVAFAATLAMPDALPAVPFVDQVLWSAFAVHPAAGVMVLGGAALLLLPAVIGLRSDPDHRAVYAVFGLIWSAAILAAALGNYPTPVVGYGGSAVLGYLLSLAMLPKVAAPLPLAVDGVPVASGRGVDPHRRVAALA